MNKKDFIEATASGLRKMDNTPDYLLIRADFFGDWCWDEYTLCGIPVIKGYTTTNTGHSGEDYPIILCFKDLPEEKIAYQTMLFQKGFEVYM